MSYGSPRGRRKKKGTEKIFEGIIVENFPNVGKETVNQVQEVQRIPYRINPRRNTLRHTLIKLTEIKHKERILKVSREKQHVTYKGKNHTIKSETFSRNSAGQKGTAEYI